MAETQSQGRISEINFKFDVSKVSTLGEVWSPELSVYGVPWKIKFSKDILNGQAWFVATLYCAKKDRSPQWTYVAYTTIKLLSFDDNTNAVKTHNWPDVYDYNHISGIVSAFYWSLFDNRKHYIRNDTIKLDIKIEMADPEAQNKSQLVLQEIGKSCSEGCSTEFSLTVTNIENLMAVRSAPFILQKEPWHFSVLKNQQSGELGIRLECISSSATFSCDVKILVKLISMKPDGKPIEQEKIKENMKRFMTYNFVSWDELCNPNNGFVNNNSIVIKVKVVFDICNVIVLGSMKRKAASPPAIDAKRYEFACKMCSKRIEGQDVSFTSCGHLFCTSCITNEITAHKKCPTCKIGLSLNQVSRAHLPYMQ